MTTLATNLAAFNKSVQRFVRQRVPEEVDRLLRAVALEAARRIIQRTPVDTGRARGNWHLTINQRSQAVFDTEDKSGTGVLGRVSAQLQGLPAYPIIYLTNNLPYIKKLEDGSSLQAPRGMVNLTLADLRQLFR